jgi:hypothetical protein
MKKLIFSIALTGLMVTPPLVLSSTADVHKTVNKTYNLETAPIDVAGSADGKFTFVLAEGGKIFIYSQSGEKNEIQVDPNMDRISTTGVGDKLLLSSSKTKKVEEIFIDFTQNFDVAGSPFLGGENAPVTIVAFSDFQ